MEEKDKMSTTRSAISALLDDVAPGIDYETCNTLVTGGHLGSLAMISLVAGLEDAFDVMIPAVEVMASNFDSVDAIEDLIVRLRGKDL